MQCLLQNWKDEWARVADELDASKRKPDQEQLLSMLRFDNQKLVTKLLRLFLERCQWKQNMAFFQFRRFMPRVHMCELKSMFDERLKFMEKVIGKVEKLKGKEFEVPEYGMDYFWQEKDSQNKDEYQKNLLKKIACKLYMDLSTKVDSLEHFNLTTPLTFDQSLARVQHHLTRTSWATDLYPYYYDSAGNMAPPKCIFLPAEKVWRVMIAAVAAKPEG